MLAGREHGRCLERERLRQGQHPPVGVPRERYSIPGAALRRTDDDRLSVSAARREGEQFQLGGRGRQWLKIQGDVKAHRGTNRNLESLAA